MAQLKKEKTQKIDKNQGEQTQVDKKNEIQEQQPNDNQIINKLIKKVKKEKREKVYFLKIDDGQIKLQKLEEELKNVLEQNENKTKKKRLYTQIVKLKKALQNPEQKFKDPQIKEEKRQKDRERQIQKKIQKGKEQKEQQSLIKKIDKICLGCKQYGHILSSCPQNKEVFQDNSKKDETKTEKEIGQNSDKICYNCGSKEHTLYQCQMKRKSELPFVICFVCKKQGHLSRDCEQNEKGLYSHGGGCFVCNSVRHVAKDCPQNQSKSYSNSNTYNNQNSYQQQSHKNPLLNKQSTFDNLNDEGEGLEPEYE